MSAQGLIRSLRASARAGVRPSRSRGRRSRRPRLRVRVALGLVACAALLGGGYMWLRDSSLVAIERVTVVGVRGPDAGQITAALEAAARGMTTLDVRVAALRAAVGNFPSVAGIRVFAQVPHGLRIVVSERTAIAKALVGGETVVLAADGTVLHDAGAAALPTITLSGAPVSARVSDPNALAELAVLAAAPRQLLGRIALTSGYWHGVVAQLRDGPRIYFGDGSRPDAKWRAALAVLAIPQVAGADYIDVTDPERAAAGLDSPPASLTTAPSSGSATTAAVNPGLPGG